MSDVITANRLTDGVVVFQTVDGHWTEDFNRAAVLPDPEATADALKHAKQDEANNVVVEPYAVAVEERNGHLAPKALREAIRAAGPTVYTVTWQSAAWLKMVAAVTPSTFAVGDHLIIVGAPARDPRSHEVTMLREVTRPRDHWHWRSTTPFAQPSTSDR